MEIVDLDQLEEGQINMPRLEPGMDPKIDMINKLVDDSRSGDKHVSEESLAALLKLFQPMILKVCKHWSTYFHDDKHKIIPFDELISHAQYWFMRYTLKDYKVNGPATYNKFIHDHVNQRIRYIYECEIKYFNKNIFPDPNQNSDSENGNDNALDDVIFNYKSDKLSDDIEGDYVDKCEEADRYKLAHTILNMLNDHSLFNEREKRIFTEVVLNGVTHEKMGACLGISRTRVTQILRKVKVKLYKEMESSKEIWTLINDTDIVFEER